MYVLNTVTESLLFFIYLLTSVLHYLSKGSAMLSFVYMKQQFFMPVCMVMRAIVNADDFGLYKQLIKGQEDNQFFKTYVWWLQSIFNI